MAGFLLFMILTFGLIPGLLLERISLEHYDLLAIIGLSAFHIGDRLDKIAENIKMSKE